MQNFRKRASTACSFCQWRKIKCDVDTHQPCSNCSSEGIDCQITKRRKTRRDNGTTSAVDVLQSSCSTTQPNIPESRTQRTSRSVQTEQQPISNDVFQRLVSTNARNCSGSLFDPTVSPAVPDSGADALRTGANGRSSSTESPRTQLPAYFNPIPERLASADIEYLTSKGSFNIPDVKFRDAILRSYVELVHPYMPLLNLTDFTTNLNQPTGNGAKLSLLVFQAVMLAGSAHVDVKPLRSMGFLTRKEARRALFERTKALYDLEYERNRLNVVQALLLMSLWFETPDDQKDGYHWLQIALTLARRAGLNHDPSEMDIPEDEKHIRKRIWWSLIIRDPLLSLGLKRPISVLPAEHHVAELSLADLEFDRSASPTLSAFGLAYDSAQVRLVSNTCLAEARLHRCLSEIMCKQYSMAQYRPARASPDPTATSAILVPLVTNAARDSLLECEARLFAWRASLCAELNATEIVPDDLDRLPRGFLACRAILHMVYHTSIIMLYRPWTKTSQRKSSSSENTDNKHSSGRMHEAVRSSARSITDLAMSVHRIDMVGHLTQTSLSALVVAVVSHLSDMLSPHKDLREIGLCGFEQCSHIMNELRENFYSADFSAEFAHIAARTKKLGRQSILTAQLYDQQRHHFDLDDQISAQRKFLAEDIEENQPSTLALLRPLPQALFPEDLDMSSETVSDRDPGNRPDPLKPSPNLFQPAAGEQQAADADYWGFYQNFPSEAARLLGEFLDESQLNGFGLGGW